MAFTIEQVRNSLPMIGDRRHGGTVDYVNSQNLWYRVRLGDGTSDSFKLPRYNSRAQITDKHSIKIVPKTVVQNRACGVKCKVLETGKTYNSYTECGADLGCTGKAVRTAVKRRKKCMGKYTIVDLEL